MKTIRTQITMADYQAFQRHAMFRYRKMHWIFGFLACLIALSSWFGGKPDEKVSQKIYVLLGSLMLWGLICIGIFLVLWIVRRIGLSRFKPTLGEHVFEVTPDGLRETTAASQIETRAAGIARVDETRQHVFVITTSGLGHIIPKRDIDDMAMLLALDPKKRANQTPQTTTGSSAPDRV